MATFDVCQGWLIYEIILSYESNRKIKTSSGTQNFKKGS